MGLQKVAVICVILACGLGAIQVAAKCGECMPNLAQCINETDFYFCQQGRPLTSMINRCGEDEVCTSTNAICVKRDQVVPDTFVCQNKCNQCPDTGYLYNRMACVSNTQFATCSNMATTNFVGTCNVGEYCNVDHYTTTGNICAPTCVLEYNSLEPTCTNEIYTTTTTVAPTVATQAPNPERLRQQCINARPSTTTRYYYTANIDDANCKSYLYCEVINNLMDYVELNCGTSFFDASVNRCTSNRPASCMPTTVAVTTSTTTTTTTTTQTTPTTPTTTATQTTPTTPTTTTTQTTPTTPTTPTTTQTTPTIPTEETAPTIPTEQTAPTAPTLPTEETAPTAPTLPTEETAPTAPTIPTEETPAPEVV